MVVVVNLVDNNIIIDSAVTKLKRYFIITCPAPHKYWSTYFVAFCNN